LVQTLSFLSCRAYGKHGMTAVTRQAEAILQALIMMSSSISMSLTSSQPLCTMYTSLPQTHSPISTLTKYIKLNTLWSQLSLIRLTKGLWGAPKTLMQSDPYPLMQRTDDKFWILVQILHTLKQSWRLRMWTLCSGD
jgi:hypothetical protein